MSNPTEPHVLIVGAGVTGLLIAHGLQKANVPYTIFETEEEGRWRSKEWTMGIHWGLPLLESLLPPDLAARIDTDGSVDPSLDWNTGPNNGALIWDGATGDLLKDLTPDGRNVRVSRRRLRKLCQEQIHIQWGHTLRQIVCADDDTSVTAVFSNGKEYTGTVLVGADGPRSTVRDYLFNHDPELGQARVLEDQIGFSMAVSYDAETAKLVRSAHPVWCIAISPELFVFQSTQEVLDPQKPEEWKFFFFPSWLGERDESLDNDGRMKELKRRGSYLKEPFRTAILAIPDDTQIPYTDVGYWIAKPWNSRNGRVTLAGDAAHPMPPYRGQGGNHAIQDAHNFVESIKEIIGAPVEHKSSVQAKLIQEYGDEVAKRGAEETQLSIKNGYMCMAYSEFKESPYMKQGLSRGKS